KASSLAQPDLPLLHSTLYRVSVPGFPGLNGFDDGLGVVPGDTSRTVPGMYVGLPLPAKTFSTTSPTWNFGLNAALSCSPDWSSADTSRSARASSVGTFASTPASLYNSPSCSRTNAASFFRSALSASVKDFTSANAFRPINFAHAQQTAPRVA